MTDRIRELQSNRFQFLQHLYESVEGRRNVIVNLYELGKTIGDGLIGLEAEEMEPPPDALELYFVDSSGEAVSVSAHGTPSEPDDMLPRTISMGSGWGGFRRLHLDSADTYSNWVRFTWDDKSPGFLQSAAIALLRSKGGSALFLYSCLDQAVRHKHHKQPRVRKVAQSHEARHPTTTVSRAGRPLFQIDSR